MNNTMIKAIMACDSQGGIAKAGSMPWPKNTKDLAWFKKNTATDVVVMGSKTWLDPHMPTPLPRRINVVVTSNPEKCPGADRYITADMDLCDELLKLKEEYSRHHIWVIGGANILEQSMDMVEQFYLTIIDGQYDCDTHIPLKDILRSHNELGSKKEDGLEFKVLEKVRMSK